MLGYHPPKSVACPRLLQNPFRVGGLGRFVERHWTLRWILGKKAIPFDRAGYYELSYAEVRRRSSDGEGCPDKVAILRSDNQTA